MKKIVTSLLMAMLGLTLYAGINDFSPKSGRILKEDDTYINEADLLETFAQTGFAISKGMCGGCIALDKYGYNDEVTTVTAPETIWNFGGVYTYTEDTGVKYYISSSNSGDTQSVKFQTLTLDSKGNFNLEIFTQDLAGQTKTELIAPSGDLFVRACGLCNDDSTGFAGNIYVYEDDTVTTGVPDTDSKVRCYATNGDNCSLMPLCTIPTGYVGFLFQKEVGVKASTDGRFDTTEYANFLYRTRRFGKTFKIDKKISSISSGTSIYSDLKTFPSVLPAKTDIQLVCDEVSATLGCFGTLDILLVLETEFSDEYLTEIGQIKRVE